MCVFVPACLNVCVSFYVNLTPYTQFRFYLIFPLLFFFGRCCKSKIYETPKNRCINVLLFRSSLVVYAKYFVCCIHLPSSLLHPISLSLSLTFPQSEFSVALTSSLRSYSKTVDYTGLRPKQKKK